MKRCRNIPICFTLAALLLPWGCDWRAADQPNFVFFLIDDLGWTDTGVYGSTFYETPNIDRLAAEGARFTQFYSASPVCSPTRASIMTGKDPARLNLTNWIGGEGSGMLLQAEYRRQLPLEEITLGEAFKQAGYATGYIGKWHLGAQGFMPPDQGFDFAFAVNHAGQPGSYFFPYENDDWLVTNVPDLEDDEPGDYLTDRLTDTALEFIEARRDTAFFLVLSHYAVHTPLEAKTELIAKYQSKAQSLATADAPPFLPEGANAMTKQRQDHPVYAGMIESTDRSVGRVLALLDSLDLAERTVIVFVSDNGGLSTLRRGRETPTANLPLRAGKGWLYEGGVRVPLIVRWPGVVEGGHVIDPPAITMDLYPTLLEIARLPLRPEQHQDGLSLVPLLQGASSLDRQRLFFHFPHYHGSGSRPSGTVRAGNFKLLEWFEDGKLELHDLSADIGESRDLAGERPELVGELHEIIEAWRRSVGARMPTPNPDWKPN
ncbi:MAG: sulfatase [Gemmatimonadales bacterium]|jgi:arylsulfatase A-like enzyme